MAWYAVGMFNPRLPGEPPARRPVFSVQQVSEFLEYEQSRREGAPYRPPPRYHDWRGAGRPRGEMPH